MDRGNLTNGVIGRNRVASVRDGLSNKTVSRSIHIGRSISGITSAITRQREKGNHVRKIIHRCLVFIELFYAA